MDDDRLKNLGGGGYWKELLQRIRDIRASEKVFYRQVLDIYATSIDYDPQSEVSVEFFKKVQNKIHYAVHGQTAAEVIFDRADAEKNLGLIGIETTGQQLFPEPWVQVVAEVTLRALPVVKFHGIRILAGITTFPDIAHPLGQRDGFLSSIRTEPFPTRDSFRFLPKLA